MKISPARQSAFEILIKIEKERSFSSILLPFYENTLNQKDSALCHQLVLGILRKKLYLDAVIRNLTKKTNLNKFDLEVVITLRIGIYQLLFLDKIPDYSAINESVNLVKKARKKSASGLVNAILRRVSREKVILEYADEIEKLSIQTSHPKWLIEKWNKQFGVKQTISLANANNIAAESSFRFTTKFFLQDEHTQKLIREDIQAVSQNSLLIDDAFQVKNYSEKLQEYSQLGLIYFQEIGSQLVAKSVELSNSESFLDVCASPGSKVTFQAMLTSKNKENNLIVAGDLYSHRIQNLRNNCLHQGNNTIKIVRYDAEKSLPFSQKSFDKVLVDAPCSGTGTIRHNPEIRYNLREKDFNNFSSKQLNILKNASELTKPGGKLIYSTCSMEVEENENVVDQFLELYPDFLKIRTNLPDQFVTDKSFIRTFPDRDNIDGFFVAVLERK
jgi:16S rRNA (cytosine967-C5)-methyltransferase